MKRYVSVEDNISCRKEVTKVIEEIEKEDYEISCHDGYDEELEKIIMEASGNNIYILDIELKGRTGIDIAREIRRNGDYESIIIFLTNHYELSMEVIKNNLMILNFIVKKKDYEKELKEVLEEAQRIVGKVRSLVIEESGVLYRIDYNEIMYIIKDTVERKTVVRTTTNEFKFNKGINEISKLLDERFEPTHRSCIVNKDYVRKFIYKESKIEFKNGDYIYMLSRSGKKRLRSNDK